LHQETLAGFFELIDVFISITRQQSNVSSINVIRVTTFTPDRFIVGPVTRRTSVRKERFLFLREGLDLRIDFLVSLKRSCQVLGVRQLAFLELGVHHFATFLVLGRRIRLANRSHDKLDPPRQFTTHTVRIGDLAA
jgi:hypothetical protein